MFIENPYFLLSQVDQDETVETKKVQPKKMDSVGTKTKSKNTAETKKAMSTDNLAKENVNNDYELLLNIENEETIKIPKGIYS